MSKKNVGRTEYYFVAITGKNPDLAFTSKTVHIDKMKARISLVENPTLNAILGGDYRETDRGSILSALHSLIGDYESLTGKYNALNALYRETANRLILTTEAGKVYITPPEVESELRELRGENRTLHEEVERLVAENTVLKDAGQTTDTLRKENDYLYEKVESLKESNASLREKMDKLEEKVSAFEAIDSRNMELCQENDELREKMDGLKFEMETLEMSKDKFKNSISHLQSELEDRDRDLETLRNENTRLKSVDVHEIVSALLDCICNTNNALIDAKVPKKILDTVGFHLEHAVDIAAAHGARITFHDRGSPIGDTAAEITSKSTENPELQGQTAKCNRFGCTFGNRSIQDIEESITVWRYNPPVEDQTVS